MTPLAGYGPAGGLSRALYARRVLEVDDGAR